MISGLQSLYTRISGNPEQFSFEHRVFNLSNFVIGVFGIIATLLNYLLGLHIMTVWLGVAGIFAPVILFYFSRIRGWFTKATIYVYIACTIAVLAPMHFFNGGTTGTVVYLIVMMMSIFLLIAQQEQQLWIFITLCGTVLLIFLLEYLNPQWVVSYNNFDEQMGDHITSVMYTMFFTMMIIRLFRKSYDNDRETILKQKRELEEAYHTTSEKKQQIESLIRELHHRVKNNLQVVSSLMALQSNRMDDEKARQAMVEGRNRVDAMAMIHQKLYMDNDLAAVDIQEYLENLVSSLASSYGYLKHQVKINVSLPQVSMDIDLAVPIGLIVNELVTNAFKYAFPTTDNPIIEVSMGQTAEGSIELRVADNGKGGIMEKDKQGSFGLKLVHTLVQQLNGSLHMCQDNGTNYNIQLKW